MQLRVYSLDIATCELSYISSTSDFHGSREAPELS